MQLDSVQIGAADVAEAARAYAVLFGIRGTPLAGGACRFQLRRGAVELEVAEPGLRSLTFAAAEGDDPRHLPESVNGLRIHLAPPATAVAAVGDDASVEAIDHVVIHSPDLDRAITSWRDDLGLRLALDREFPARGLRMLFFRSAGITLEFVSSLQPSSDRSGPDGFYGIAYRVRRIEACRSRLLDAGLDVSSIRPGNKSATRVVTVHSGAAGVPTLLIEDPARAS